MYNPTVAINGVEYPLDTTLRVAYHVQGMNNHKPYSKVFEELGDMTLEKQIEILYVAFRIANPEVAKTFTQLMFFNYYIENFNLKEVMAQLKGVIKGVLGEDSDEDGDEAAKTNNPGN